MLDNLQICESKYHFNPSSSFSYAQKLDALKFVLQVSLMFTLGVQNFN